MERSIHAPAVPESDDGAMAPPSVAVVAAKPAAVRPPSGQSTSNFTPGTIAASIAVLIVFLAAWEWIPRAAGVPEFVLPPPSKVWAEFLRMLSHDRLLWHTGITAVEIIVGFVLGSLLGIVIGFVLGVAVNLWEHGFLR